MKRIIYLASILITGALISMYSCTKENDSKTAKTEECRTCDDGTVLAKQIKQFKDRLQAARESIYKDGDEMTKGEAIQNMGMLFNASHGFATETYVRIQIDTVEFSLPVDGQGNIAATDVALAYDGLENSVKTVYDNIGYSEKHIVALALQGNESNNVSAIVTTGEKGPNTTSNHFNFCWWYGKNKGMCNGNLFGMMDGGDTLANELFAFRPIPGFDCIPGYHKITVPDYEGTFDGTGVLEEGYVFYLQKDINTLFTQDEQQLSASEMNYWYDQEHDFLFTVLPQSLNKPWNWVMTSLAIDGNEHFNYTNNKHWINHINNVKYGLIYCVQDYIIEPPSDL